MYVSLVHVFQTTAERVCQQKHKLLVCIPFHVLPLLNKLFTKIAGCKGLQKNMFRLFLMMNFSVHIISTVDWIFELEFFGNCNALASFDVEDVNGSHHITS